MAQNAYFMLICC